MEDKTPLTAEAILAQYDPMNAESNILSAMEEYAAQQTASLQERVKELENHNDMLKRDAEDDLIRLDQKDARIAELSQLNEKLMGLLEKEVKSTHYRKLDQTTDYGVAQMKMQSNQHWNLFCVKNKIATDGK